MLIRREEISSGKQKSEQDRLGGKHIIKFDMYCKIKVFWSEVDMYY